MVEAIVERVLKGAIFLRDYGTNQPLPTTDINMPGTLNEWLVSLSILEIIPPAESSESEK
jgi:hypothetical protein